MIEGRTYHIHDTSVFVRWPHGLTATARGKAYAALRRVLAENGFKVGTDREIKARFPILAKGHHEGRKGVLEVRMHVFQTGCEFAFHQDVVFSNPNGGRYDFDRREKMPYLVGKAFELARSRLVAWLDSRGYADTTPIASPVPDPLAWFNGRWDSHRDRLRGEHRFPRGADGWPILDDGYYAKDADGAVLATGMRRHFRSGKGHLMVGTIYGGINSMWTVIHGPGKRDTRTLHASELFTSNGSTPRKLHPRGESLRKKAMASKAMTGITPAERMAA